MSNQKILQRWLLAITSTSNFASLCYLYRKILTNHSSSTKFSSNRVTDDLTTNFPTGLYYSRSVDWSGSLDYLNQQFYSVRLNTSNFASLSHLQRTRFLSIYSCKLYGYIQDTNIDRFSYWNIDQNYHNQLS